MSNKKLIRSLGIAAVPAACAVSLSAQEARPNIVVIIGDDISRDDFACYGNPQVKTPNTDALAAAGIRFNNVFLTASSSSPSRTSIMTGRYPHNTGACELHSTMGEEQVIFPALLQKAGYYTAQAGKFHIGNPTTEPSGPAVKYFDRVGGSRKEGGGDSGCEMWVPYLRERPKDKPFFMWFASHDAHRNYWDKSLFLPPYNPDEIVPGPFYVNDEVTRRDLAGHYNEVTRLDYFIGEVVKELTAQGVLDNTIIVVMADNGRGFPRAKTMLVHDGILTPFVVHYPNGIKQQGAVCNSLVSVVDLAPTLTELARAGSSETFQGESFTRLLADPGRKFRNYVFAEHNWHVQESYERMVATDEWLLIENKRPNLPIRSLMDVPAARSLKKGREAGTLTELQSLVFGVPRPDVELFNRTKDPLTAHNVADGNRKKVQELLGVLHRWQDETGDTVPEFLKPDRSKEKSTPPEYLQKVEMPGASRGAVRIHAHGPF